MRIGSVKFRPIFLLYGGSMKGIIWYQKDSDQGWQILRRIIKNYEAIGIHIAPFYYACRKDHCIFDNGDRWDVVVAREGSRGHKCNISYVSQLIPEEFINVVIIPCTIAYPYHGVNYWYEEPITAPNANV